MVNLLVDPSRQIRTIAGSPVLNAEICVETTSSTSGPVRSMYFGSGVGVKFVQVKSVDEVAVAVCAYVTPTVNEVAVVAVTV